MSYKGHKGGKKSNVYDSEEGYNLWASKYDESEGYLNSFEKDVFWKILGDLSTDPRGWRILDAGCGTGRMIKAFLHGENEVIGLDSSEKMLELAREKFPRVQFIKGDIEKLPFEDNSFDIVFAAFVIVHLKYPDRAFDEVYRVLKPGGTFFLTNINQKKAPKLSTKDGQKIVIQSHYHRPQDVIKTLKNSFFEIEVEEFVNDRGVWINQIIKATKS